MTQRWGDQYFHFFVETLPRITLILDILREHLDIKVPDCVAWRDSQNDNPTVGTSYQTCFRTAENLRMPAVSMILNLCTRGH